MRSVAKTEADLERITTHSLFHLYEPGELRMFQAYSLSVMTGIKDSLLAAGNNFMAPVHAWLEDWVKRGKGKWCSVPLNYYLVLWLNNLQDAEARTACLEALNGSVRRALAIPAVLGREDKVFPIADLPVTPAARSCIAHPSRLLRENIGTWNTLNNLLTALVFALLNREADISAYILQTLAECSYLLPLPFEVSPGSGSAPENCDVFLPLYSPSSEVSNVMIFGKAPVEAAGMAFGGLLRHPEYHYRLGCGGWRKGGDKEQRSQHRARLLAYLSVTTAESREASEKACAVFSGTCL